MSSTCSVCNNLLDDLPQDSVKSRLQKHAVCKRFETFIPGLDPNAEIKQLFDENLAPLRQNISRFIEYNHTFSSSISTDDKDGLLEFVWILKSLREFSKRRQFLYISR